jgi:hypothetical protein
MRPDAAGKDGNPANDRYVSTISIIDPAMLPAADLAIFNVAMQDSCAAGGECRFILAATNNGPAIFDGSITVSGTLDPATAQLTGSSPPDWSCGGSDGQFDCMLSKVSLDVGESRPLVLTFTTGQSARGTLSSCGAVSRGIEAGVADVQRALNEAGFNAGYPDGVAGRRTRIAISAYQEAYGMAVTGKIDTAFLRSLFASTPSDAVAENDRVCAQAELVE